MRGNTLKRLNAQKTVTFFGGICLLINSMTGAPIPFTPQIFQTLGWIAPTVLFLFFAVVSAFAVLFIIESMQAIPGNRHFQGTVEFSTLINFFFGPVAHMIGQFFLYGAIMSQCIQNIVVTAQSFDNLLVTIFKKTCGVAWPAAGKSFQWVCVNEVSTGSGSPFPDITMVFTFGLLLVLVLGIPLSLMNLDDNISLQMGAFCFTVLILSQWISSSIASGLKPSYVPPFALKPGYQSALGTIMQNMACSIFVPSWINLKRRNVNAQSTVWTAMLIAVLLYLSFGNISALAYDIPDSGNIIPTLSINGIPRILSTATCYAFAFIMLLPSIPVSFIVAENNLTQNKVCPRFVAVFMCYILPWFAAMPLQTGDKLGIFLSWSGLLFVSTANFVIPFFIYLQCLRFRKVYNEKRILSDKQKWLLKTIHNASNTIANFIDDNTEAPVRRGGLRGATVVKRSLRRPSTRASQTPTLRRRITGTPGNDIPAEPDHDAYPRKPVRPRPGNQKSEYRMAEEEEDQGAVEWGRKVTVKKDIRESQATLAEGDTLHADGLLHPEDIPIQEVDGGSMSRSRSRSPGERSTSSRGVRFGGATSDAEEDGIETEETDTVEEPLESWIYDEDVPDPDAEDGKKGWGATELERNIEGAITKVGTMSRKVLRKITKKERSSSSPTPPSDEVTASDRRNTSPAKPKSRSPSPNPPSSMKRERGISTASAPVGGSLPSEDASFISSKDPARRESNVSAATYPDVTPSSVATPSRIIPTTEPTSPDTPTSPITPAGIHRLKSTDGLLTPHPLRTSTYPKSTTSSASHPPSPSHARFSNLPDSPVESLEMTSMGGLGRRTTLPTHPDFVAPAFRSVPRWMGIRGWVLALVLGVLTTLLTLANVVVFLVIPTNSASTNGTVVNSTMGRFVGLGEEGMFGLHQKGWYYGAVSGN